MEKLLVDKIGVDAYRAWLRVAYWDEQCQLVATASRKPKDEVVALLRTAPPGRKCVVHPDVIVKPLSFGIHRRSAPLRSRAAKLMIRHRIRRVCIRYS